METRLKNDLCFSFQKLKTEFENTNFIEVLILVDFSYFDNFLTYACIEMLISAKRV